MCATSNNDATARRLFLEYGASQHISMLALDVQQYGDKRIREILAENGWFQTVKSDLPHSTYLGLTRDRLEGQGLKKELAGSQEFWIPAIM